MATATATAVPHYRGYHVYQRIWTPHVGEKATTVRESGNEHDRFTVSVLEDETLYTAVSRSFFLVVQDLSLFASLVVQR